MYLLKLIARNLLRHPLRSGLTLLGIVVAISAFGLLRTTIEAWYAGVDASSATRLIVRNKNSLVFPLPLHYGAKIRSVEGVASISYADWFGGVYIDKKNFFPQFAIEPRTYFALFPEYVMKPEEVNAFYRNRRGAIAGRKTADQYGWEVGDQIPIQGTIFQGTWNFVLEGIYEGRDNKTDVTQFFFHWDYLNNTLRHTAPDNVDQVGIYLVGLKRAQDAPLVAQEIDALFKNSRDQTLTETEKAFQLSFVSMTEAILLVIQVVSFLIIAIIMAVMANTMAMTARERKPEYATLKALGFRPMFVAWLIIGESLLMACVAGIIGIVLTYPMAAKVAVRFGTIFPIFNVSQTTVMMCAVAAVAVGTLAAVVPAYQAAQTPVTEGMRAIV